MSDNIFIHFLLMFQLKFLHTAPLNNLNKDKEMSCYNPLIKGQEKND